MTDSAPHPSQRVGSALGLTGHPPHRALNAITDVPGVRVGALHPDRRGRRPHRCRHLPTGTSQEKVPAGLAVGNGYGKTGATQLMELGELETPILLTNTLAAPRAAEALIEYTLSQPGNEAVTSVNPVVGETNDGWLNNIRLRRLKVENFLAAIESAREGEVAEGAVGAGTGTVAFGWKGGIGTSSRTLPQSLGGYTVGALVQTSIPGRADGRHPVGQALGHYLRMSWISAAARS